MNKNSNKSIEEQSEKGEGNEGCSGSEVGDDAAILDEGLSSLSEEIADKQRHETWGEKEREKLGPSHQPLLHSGQERSNHIKWAKHPFLGRKDTEEDRP